MRVSERLSQQAALVGELVRELETERSYRGIERLVQVIIQALLDLGLMAISALGGRKPDTYSEVGRVLHDLGVLNGGDAELLKSMAGLRNLLVHAYAAVDRKRLASFAESLRADAARIASLLTEGARSRGVDPEKHADEGIRDAVRRLSRVLSGRVKAAYLFGGRAKGYVLKGDYDLAVLMRDGYSLYDLGELQVEAARALEVGEEQVNLVCLNEAPPEIAFEALEGVPVVEERSEEAFDLKLRALRELLDLKEGARAAERVLRGLKRTR